MSFATDVEISEGPGSITPRGVFVPPWYKPHSTLDVQVLSTAGKPLGFTVGDVAVERRWAIAPDGQVIGGSEFIDRLTDWYIGQWTWRNPPQPSLPVDTSGYPTPENFVSKGPDPANPRRVISLTLPNHRKSVAPAERPVDAAALAAAGWKPAPKKDNP